MTDRPNELTILLRQAAHGDRRAADVAFPIVYAELRALADRAMASSAGGTLQPTALVHEAYMRLATPDPNAGWNDRAHFLAVAAKAMRSILVDHARARHTRKRGDGERGIPLEEHLAAIEDETGDLVALHEALDDLEALDPELARVVDLRYFAGLGVDETARVLEVSEPTVVRRFSVARLWLKERLSR